MGKTRAMLITTGRADYGLLFPLVVKLRESKQFQALLAATGSHFSAFHGNTCELIEKDGIAIDAAIKLPLTGDGESDVCKAISEGVVGFSRAFSELKPDFAVVLGDRYELLAACSAALVHRIPLVHIHGGELTFGAMDDAIRHAVTKMAVLHFPSLEIYAKRILQMGESPERVFPVGALGIDNIRTIELMSREELSAFSGADFSQSVVLLTYHPVTLEGVSGAAEQIGEVLQALSRTDLFVLATMPNQDAAGREIFRELERYAAENPRRCRIVKNLGQRGYLSAMRYARVMVGNSSSGIIESSSFRLPVVNIGSRQDGRYRTPNIIDCPCCENDIRDALQAALSDDFRDSLAGMRSPYGEGDTAARIVAALEAVDFSDKEKLLKKGFRDLSFG